EGELIICVIQVIHPRNTTHVCTKCNTFFIVFSKAAVNTGSSSTAGKRYLMVAESSVAENFIMPVGIDLRNRIQSSVSSQFSIISQRLITGIIRRIKPSGHVLVIINRISRIVAYQN